MSLKYIFPSQRILAGTVDIEVVVSNNTGSDVVLTDKYFSDELTIPRELEYEGGDLQAAYADFVIDYDADNLFGGTIIPCAQTFGEFVTIKVRLNGETKFYGTIDPRLVRKEPYHSATDDLDNPQSRYSFRALWLPVLGKYITKSEFYVQALTHTQSITYFSAGAAKSYQGISIRNIAQTFFELMESKYGFTYSLTFDLINVNLFGPEGEDSDTPFNSYNIPVVQGAGIGRGNLDSVNLLDATLAIFDPTGSPSSVLGVFNDNYTGINSGYDFFAAILKDPGLVCTIGHNDDVDLIVKIGTRVSGDPVPLMDILSFEDSPIAEVSRIGIDIGSLTSGNNYKKQFTNFGESDLTRQVNLDFGNDYDFPGGESPVNSELSLMYPVQDPQPVYVDGANVALPHFEMMRYAGIGENKITNGTFGDGLTGWTQTAGSWSVIDSRGLFLARTPMTTTDEKELTWTFDTPLDPRELYIFSGLFLKGWDGGYVDIQFKFYFGSTGYTFSDNAKRITTQNYQLKYGLKLGYVNSDEITKVGITVTPNAANASNYFHMGRMQFYPERKGTPELNGKLVEQYFNDPFLTRKIIRMNGVRADIDPRDYFNLRTPRRTNTKYFFKKVSWNLRNNETEVEAIDYPE